MCSTQLIHRICHLCGHKEGSNYYFPGSHPVTLDHGRKSHLLNNKYYVSWKADGTRYMMYIRGKGQVYLLRRDNQLFPVENITFPHSCEQDHVAETLLGCEMVVENRPEGGRRPCLLLYDLVAYAGENKFGMMRHHKRIDKIGKDIYEPREKASLALRIDKGKEPFSVRLKEFFPLSETGMVYNEYIPKLHHEIDGLIFSMDNQGYFPGRWEWLLKWKPLSLNSIDFRLKIVTIPARLGELGGKHYQFLVLENGTGIERMFYGFEQKKFIRTGEFKLEDLDNKIVECTLEENCIRIIRVRTDKTKPNTMSTAKNVRESILQPLGIEELLEFINTIPQTFPLPYTSFPVSKSLELGNHRPTNSSNLHHKTELNHETKRQKVESLIIQNQI